MSYRRSILSKNKGGRYTCLCGASLTEEVGKAAAELAENLNGKKTVEAKTAKTIKVVCKCGKEFSATKQPRRSIWKLKFIKPQRGPTMKFGNIVRGGISR